MQRLIPILLVLALAPPATAQLPSDLEAVELARSRQCVDVLARLAVLDEELAPLAARSQRLLAIAQAIAIEESAVVNSLDASDPVEAEVRAWFLADGELAQRYVAEQSPQLVEERAAGREAIKVRIAEALQTVQEEADQVITATGSLQADTGPCNGAVFLRGAIAETCQTRESPVCEAVRDSVAGRGPFRFVESAEDLWGLQEIRAWTAPGPLQVTPTGQLGGARTVGFTRNGNVVVTVAFSTLLRQRGDLTPPEIERTRAVNDSLGFEGSHPDIVFSPSLAIQASLPVPIGGESSYLLHFGEPESADVIWTAEAGSGAPIDGIVELSPAHVAKLQAGEPLTLTALRENESGDYDAVYAIELTSLNQAPAVQALLGYMAQGLSGDLVRLVPPGNS